MEFEVVFTGALREGFGRRRGIGLLASQFSLDFNQIRYLLSGARPVVKRVPDRHRAEGIVKALWSQGWHSELRLGKSILFDTSDARGQGGSNTATRTIRQISADSSISLLLPANWQICDELNLRAVLQAGDRELHTYAVVLQQDRRELPVTLNLAEYSAAQLKQCVAKVDAGDVLAEPGLLDNARHEAYVAQMGAELNGAAIRYVIACLQWKQFFYTVFLWCEKQNFAVNEALFLQIVRDLEVETSAPLAAEECLEAEVL